MDLLSLSALELSAKIRAAEITVREALDAAYRAIELEEPRIHAFISLCKEQAYEKAQSVQEKIDAGEKLSPLAGVPIAVKDNICTKNLRTTCASRMLEDFIPSYNAHVIDLIEQAGLVVVGKTNLDEFAMGATGRSSALVDTRNPLDTGRIPGGSSCGSASAVAAGEVWLALGTDTGGSIRNPSSHCGVVGLKPTYGSVSRLGAVAYASSFDQVGPIAKSAADCAALYSIIQGKDCRDSMSAKSEAVKLTDVEGYSLYGKKIGIPKEFFSEDIQPEVALRVREAVDKLSSMGAVVEEFDFPLTKQAVPTYQILANAEAASNMARFDGIKYGHCSADADDLKSLYLKSRSEGFGIEVKRRIMLGNLALMSGNYERYYIKAMQIRRLIQEAFVKAFEKYDIVLGPVYPAVAYKLEEIPNDLVKLYNNGANTMIVNLAGLPALSIPCGKTSDGMPVGLQLIAKAFDEKTILGAAQAYQNAS